MAPIGMSAKAGRTRLRRYESSRAVVGVTPVDPSGWLFGEVTEADPSERGSM